MHLQSSPRLIALTLLPLLSHLPPVRAHGYLAKVVIDGTSYSGNVPNAEPTPSIVRQINTISPVKGASNPFLNCGQHAQKAALVADANPGSRLQFWWLDGDGTHWPHNIGPIMTYMTPCLNTTCDQYDPTSAAWFKIDETGLEPGNTTWYQQHIMNGSPANLTLPSTLQSGQYLIRHEIIALHLATTIGGAEFYPSCTQVNVSGAQVGTATAREEVTFPGGYSDDDPGIYDPTVFDTPIQQYAFPGPPVAAFVSESGSATTPTSGSSPGATASATSAPSASPGGGGATCALRQQPLMAAVHRRRSLSHTMAAWIRSIGS